MGNNTVTSKMRPQKEEQAPLRGSFECLFPFETLSWSDGTYDLFELPRGMNITRSEALGFYTDESRVELEKIRAGAIEKQTSFTLDVEITTALGKTRWIRLVTHVEYRDGVPHRVYGTKEDITAQRLAGR
jgi:two-component system sensor kinase FixL